ncbi:unnamed protein product [Trichobilharzia szidati]|nr:unnamed protein product [Trichobilharzia szidati]
MMLSMQFILLLVVPLALADWDVNTAKLLRLHNEYRQQLLDCKVEGQPAAKRMPPLQWDEELASEAKELSRMCKFPTNSPTSKRFRSVGQNAGTCTNVENVMKEWFSQHKFYNFKNNQCSGQCLTYLQIIFENTTHIGCGVSKCQRGDQNHYLFAVCNYGPG